MTKGSRLLAVVATVLCLANPGFAQDTTGRIEGQLVKEDEGVANVVVLINELNLNEVTDDDGRFAFEAVCRAWPKSGRPGWAARPAFAHGSETRTEDGSVAFLASYHPSRQNTQTGRLTRPMFHTPFARARAILEES